MIRILHAADLHLDSPFQAMGRDRAAMRRTEQRALLTAMADLARERKADIALFAGDLFDADSAYSETLRLLEQVLPDMGIPVFIAPGNHDWYGERSPWARLRLGENVHVFDSETIQCVPLPALNARVWGAAFTAKHRSPPLAGFEAAKDGDTADIMVLHGEVGDPASPYGAISEEDIARSGMDYIALGHVHTCGGLRRAGDTFYAWPGCPEGRGFDETGEKGVLLVEVSPGTCRSELRPMGGRRYEILRVDVTDSRDHVSAVLAALDRDAARDIYRVVLTGRPEMAPDLPAMMRALEDRFFALELRDETVIPRDLWEDRDQDSLRGLYLARLWRMYETAEEPDRDRIVRAARYGLRALDNGEDLPLM